MARLAGETLITLLQPGDYFIIDKIDRLWRSVEDFVDVMKLFKSRGVNLCIVNMMVASVTLGTPMGDFMLNLMVCIAQLESDQCSRQRHAVIRLVSRDTALHGGDCPDGRRRKAGLQRHPRQDANPLPRVHGRKVLQGRARQEGLDLVHDLQVLLARETIPGATHFHPNTIKFSVFDSPKSSGKVFRDIGRSEPGMPNPFPFLDGRAIPTLAELRRMAA